MKKITEQQVEQFLIKAGHEAVPALLLRKNALKKSLIKRIVARRSPYAPFARVFVPVLLILLVVFMGAERKNGLPSEVVSFLENSNVAVSQIPVAEKDLLSLQAGVDISTIFTMITEGSDVSFVEGVPNFELDGDPAVMMMVAPTAFKTTGPVDDSVSGEAEPGQNLRAMNADSDTATFEPVAYTVEPFLPVTFIRFVNTSGKAFIVGFDERFVPVSLIEETLPE